MTLAGAPPIVLASVLAAGALAIVGLYLLRGGRREVAVAFGPLWDRVLDATDRPWSRLPPRRFLSLLLALVILSLIIISAGDPRPASRAARSIVVVVDASASMQATDEVGEHGEAVARIDRAKREVRKLLDAVAPPDRALLVRLDAHPRPLGPFTSDPILLDAQLRSLEGYGGVRPPHLTPGASAQGEPVEGYGGGYGGVRPPHLTLSASAQGNADEALRLAGNLLAGQPGPTVILVGDGAGSEAAAAAIVPAQSGIDLRFIPIGHTGDNVGITAFSARRHPSHPGDYEVLVEVTSRFAHPVEVELSIFQSEALVHTERIALAPGRAQRRILPDLAGRGQRLEARIGLVSPPADSGRAPLDVYAADDRAFAVLPARPRARVLLVTDGNFYLEGALLLDEAAVVDKIAPAAWSEARARMHDIVVLDRFTPPSPPPVPALYIDPHGPSGPFPIRGELRAPVVTAVAPHPLTRFVSLADLNVTSASRFALAPGDVALASSLSDPIWIARERPLRVAALGFDVRRSDLPLRVAFPVMMIDAVDWLSGEDRAREAPASAIVGRSVPIRVTSGESEVTVRGPDATSLRLPVVDGAAHLAPEAAGFYSFGEGADSTVIAVNVDPAEARITPGALVTGREIPRPNERPRADRREPWRLLGLAALLLLVLEWVTFHRRVTE